MVDRKKLVSVVLLAVLLASCFPLMVNADASIETGKVLVRSWLTGNSVNLFGVVESAPVVEPTVNPADVSADDAAALAVVFGFIAIALAVAFGVSKRK